MNWRYAVGEVVLIVVGVSIALAANSWWEDRQQRADELAMLAELRNSLAVDLEEFERYQQMHLEQERDVIALVEHMEGSEAYEPRMAPLFRSVRSWRGVSPNRAAYEALKSRGFDLITNDELRQNLIFYYEELGPAVTNAAVNDREFVTGRVNPYMDRNFVALDATVMEPLDYEQLRSDAYFRNLCMMKLFRLQTFILPNYQSAIKMIRSVITEIERELDAIP